MLYIRMLLIMGMMLYTSRIVLEMLGETDYGIYNVVGGIVTMMGFLSASLSGATSRFITFELGRDTGGDVSRVFRCALTVHYLLGAIIFLLSETVGLWFVLEKMVIPSQRLTAAIVVYQCSVVTVVIRLISTPYNALIIAHERMSAFAYISIVEIVAQLVIVFALLNATNDRLIVYASLLLLLQIIIRFIYMFYCKYSFSESNSRWLWDKQLSRTFFIYAGWTLNGNLAVIGYTQGLNLLLNLFFGPAVNAARAIAVQIQTGVNQFSQNFQMALRPPIIKSYACGSLNYMHKLLISHAKYSFYLVLVIAMPILIYTEYVLQLWLVHVPAHTVAFCRLMLIISLYCTLNGHVIQAVHATGYLKNFQIAEGMLLLSVVPIAYCLLKYVHISAEEVFIVYLAVEFITQFVRVWIVYPYIQMSRKIYFVEILFPITKTIIPLGLLGAYLYFNFPIYNFGIFIVRVFVCIVCSLIAIYTLGLNNIERQQVIRIGKNVAHHFKSFVK